MPGKGVDSATARSIVRALLAGGHGRGPLFCVFRHGPQIMFAVIRTGGKQYKVAKDDVIQVEKLDAEPGAKISLDEVLMVDSGKGVTVGQPLVAGAKVQAEVVEQTRGDKIIVFKMKRRKNYRRTKGHRQDVTVLKITDIKASA